MLLSVSTTHRPARDLGYLVHKHPDRVHEVDVGVGRAVAFFPTATDDECEFALTLVVDPVALVRGRHGRGDGPLDQYVNDRPYAASSLLAVALSRLTRDAMAGRCKERPGLAETPIDLRATVTVTPVPVRGRPSLVRELFEPLGYDVSVEEHDLDQERTDLGRSPYVTLGLSARTRLADLLTHLYVLLPVLDDSKHYFVDEAEAAKLVSRGGTWLAAHPSRDLIVSRYLKGQRTLVAAFGQLAGHDGHVEDAPPRERRLHETRLDHVAALVARTGARSVADLGCGTGGLLRRLTSVPGIERLLGMDVSPSELARARRGFEDPARPPRIIPKIVHGSLVYADPRLRGFDVATLVEVVEHFDPARLVHVERSLFGDARPRTVVVTTPNAEYNELYPGLDAGRSRHPDHRFEWTREQFEGWAERVATAYGYEVTFEGVGEAHPTLGAPGQIGIFTR